MRAYAFILCLLTFCGCVEAQLTPTPDPSSTPLVRTVASGGRQTIHFLARLDADCPIAGYVTVRIITSAVHGELTTERGVNYTYYPKENQRYQCNLQKSPLTNVYYKSSPGYVGSDTATIEVDSPILAIVRPTTYRITVK